MAALHETHRLPNDKKGVEGREGQLQEGKGQWKRDLALIWVLVKELQPFPTMKQSRGEEVTLISVLNAYPCTTVVYTEPPSQMLLLGCDVSLGSRLNLLSQAAP